ncbi:MAG: hypothetical protein BV457_08450 [Thermoplasmata archaeon M9B1D]|nr:MAG: hypothetical protein BV457_08450 [Thermoplasmata archaeon M9B1D]
MTNLELLNQWFDDLDKTRKKCAKLSGLTIKQVKDFMQLTPYSTYDFYEYLTGEKEDEFLTKLYEEYRRRL